MCRFVKDVTYPDGTTVQPGSTFVKTWRIRNDGCTPWGPAISLQSAGGDVLTPSSLPPTVVASLQPGEEVDVSVEMTAPDVTGRHVAYFKLYDENKGSFFGQRLWADIRVSDDESGWQHVSGLLSRELVNNASVANSEQVTVEETPVLPSTPLTVYGRALDVDESSLLPPVPAAQVGKEQEWARELGLLSEMGFQDTQINLALLEEETRTPEGLQRVIATLLSRSGVHF